jgi:hypothetical protein
MPDEPTSPGQDRDPQWWLLIRRSFAIPDLVSDEVAAVRLRESFIRGGIVLGQMRTLPPNPAEWPPVINAILDKVCEFGEEGRLDEYLADAKDHDLQTTASGLMASVYPGVPQTTQVGDVGEVTLVKQVLERVKAFVAAHPFTDSAGHYFR